MRLLLDTHAWLWWLNEPDRLCEKARTTIEDADNTVFVSSVTVWEIAIKSSLGRLELPQPCGAFVERTMRENRFTPLPMVHSHAAAVVELPPLHKDPFDRLLLAQSRIESLTLATADQAILDYGGRLLDCR